MAPRRAGFVDLALAGRIARLAAPVVVAMISRTLLSMVDTAMVGRLGPAAIAAVGLGALVVWTLIAGVYAISIGTQAIVARRVGEDRPAAAGAALAAALLLTAVIGVPLTAASLLGVHRLGPWFVDDPAVLPLLTVYMRIRSAEILADMFIASCRGFFDGIGRTAVHMKVMVLTNLLNVVLNYLLIFGQAGFPRLGVTGAAIGSVVSTYVGAGWMLVYLLSPAVQRRYQVLRPAGVQSATVRTLVRLSLPAAVRGCLIALGFAIFLKIMGMVGTTTLAASNIVMVITSLSWMPAVGLGVGAAILVGQHLGAKEPQVAERVGWESVKIALVCMGALGVLFMAAPAACVRLFTNDPAVVAEGAAALYLMGFMQLLDAFGVTTSSCLEGAGNTAFVMKLELCCNYLLFLPLTYLLSITGGWGIAGGWGSLLVYGLVFAVIATREFQAGRWKRIEV